MKQPKNRTVHGVALGIALCAMVTGLLCTIIFPEPFVSAFIIFGSIFIVTFFSALYFIRRYVNFRIRPLYQILLSKNLRLRDLPQNVDLVEDIQEKLTSWADTSAEEIARLRRSDEFRKDYIGNVAHELKTPLFSIQGYIHTLLEGGLKDNTVNRRFLERAEQNVERLISLSLDLDELALYESGKFELEIEQFDMVQLAREVAQSFDYEAAQKGIRFIIGSEDAQPPVFVCSERKRIGQVTLNLISNAIKYGREGGTIRINFIDGFDKIVVEVEDNGIGIAKEHLPLIFERFFRADKSRSRAQGGTGLGLSIVKQIIDAYDETITVRSKLDEGTTFSFTVSKTPPNIKPTSAID